MADIKAIIEARKLQKAKEEAEANKEVPKEEPQLAKHKALSIKERVRANLAAKALANKQAEEKTKPEKEVSSKDRLAAALAKYKEEKKLKEEKEEIPPQDKVLPISPPETLGANTTTGMNGEVITYNERQEEFVTTLGKGKSCVLIGAAGTGKTTATKGGLNNLIQSGVAGVLTISEDAPHKHLTSGTPGAVIISYTRRAVNNIRKVQSEDMKHNCITSHKLLEYQPVDKTIINEETGEKRVSRVFEPARNASNKLPSSLKVIIVEEASMLSVELYKEIVLALPKDIIWVFIGDLNQLPPVFGSAILGYKLLELPVIELTEVYRQALESPIIRLAHRILSGKPIPVKEFPEWKTEGKLTLHPWKKKLNADNACIILMKFFANAYDNDAYNPDEDIILIPYNKGCGTIELNKGIANHIARKHGRLTHEIVAGFNKHYLSVGDYVLVDREDGEIIEIERNHKYLGKMPQQPSRFLDYWGCNQDPEAAGLEDEEEEQDIDAMLDSLADTDVEERTTQCSHIIKVKLKDTERTVELKSASEVNNLLLSYAMTVHKSQGSEWRKVFLCLHQTHATMLQRELLYTGVTRAREELYVICEPDSFVKGIKSQKIKGDTLAEKAEFFKGKLEANDGY